MLKPKTAAKYFVAICHGQLPPEDPWKSYNPTERKFRSLCLAAGIPTDQLKLVFDHTRGTLSFRHYLRTNGITRHLATPPGGPFNHNPAFPFREWPRELGVTNKKFGPFSDRGDARLEDSQLAEEVNVLAYLFQDRRPDSIITYRAIRGRFETWLGEFQGYYQRPARVTLGHLESALSQRSILAQVELQEAMGEFSDRMQQLALPPR